MGIEYVTDSGPDGSVVGKTSTSLIGFFGATPVVQQAVVAASADTTTTTSTTTALTTDLDELRTKFNSVLAKLKTLGLIAS